MKKHIQLFLEWKAGHAPKAAINYRPILNRFATIAKKETVRLTVEDITTFQYLNSLKYKSSTCRYQSIALKQFIKFAYKRGWTKVDADFIRLPRADEPAPEVLMPEEFEDMCLTVSDATFSGLTRLLVFNLLWSTGMRVSELCSLSINDLNLEERMAQIRTLKNRKMRWIMWDDETHRLLLTYLGVRLTINNQPYLLINDRHRKLQVKSVQRWVRQACLDAGIQKCITPHKFRHGKGHAIVESGGDVKDVQEILGHSETNPIASFRYIRLNREEFKKRAMRFLRVIHSGVGTS